MSTALSLLDSFPKKTAPSSCPTYEVSLIKKMIHYSPGIVGQIVSFEPVWIYTGIVTAPHADAALESALYEYFTEHLIRRWSRRSCCLSAETLMDIDLWANDLAQAALRRAGHAGQVIYFAVDPWEPNLFTIGFERSL